jgi:hypothetical protein
LAVGSTRLACKPALLANVTATLVPPKSTQAFKPVKEAKTEVGSAKSVMLSLKDGHYSFSLFIQQSDRQIRSSHQKNHVGNWDLSRFAKRAKRQIAVEFCESALF